MAIKIRLRATMSSKVETKLGHKKNAPSKDVEVTWLIRIHESDTSCEVFLVNLSFWSVFSNRKYVKNIRIPDKTRKLKTFTEVICRKKPASQAVNGPYCENAPE
jgi:hypothetical protein